MVIVTGGGLAVQGRAPRWHACRSAAGDPVCPANNLLPLPGTRRRTAHLEHHATDRALWDEVYHGATLRDGQ